MTTLIINLEDKVYSISHEEFIKLKEAMKPFQKMLNEILTEEFAKPICNEDELDCEHKLKIN